MIGGATSVVESGDGYLWLASPRGLIRFDGVRFTLIDSSITPALRSRRPGMFTPRYTDQKGTLWLSRPDGAVVTYRDRRFQVVADSLPTRETQIIGDSTGRVYLWARSANWIGTIDSAGRLDSIPLPRAPNFVLTGAMVAPNGTLWLGADPGLLWRRGSDGWAAVEPPEDNSYGPVIPLLLARDGGLWATARGSLHRREAGGWAPVTLADRPGILVNATRVVEDRYGSVWIASNNFGLLRWSGGVLEKYEVADGLSGASALSVYVNSAGVAWVTTSAGLDRLRPAPLSAIADVGPFRMTSLTRLVQDIDGIAWAELDNGRGFARFAGGPIAGTNEPFTADSVRLPGTPTRGYQLFGAARTGGAWIGPRRGGLGKIGRRGYEDLDASADMPMVRQWRMLEATDGALWSASLSGGVGRVRNGRYSPIALSGTNAPSVSSFAEDGRGHVWISLDRSPTVFAMRGDSVVRRLDDAAGVRDTVLLLVAERGDTLWGVGTRSLVRIAGDRAVTIESAAIPRLRGSLLRRTAGVPSLGAFLAHGRLWIAGEGGIGHFSVAQLHAAADTRGAPPQPTLLDAHDGIPVPTVRSLTLDPVSASPDGRFFIRTATGLAVLDPRRMIADARPPRPIIEEVTVGGRAMPLDRAIEIGPNPERVEVRVTATSAAFPERVRLEHRLDGAETAWVPTGASRTVTYTQLRPGTYTFHVRSPNASTGGDPAEATLSFRVMPAWYQAWWFAGLAILIVAAGGPAAVFVYLRHRGRLREAQMQARFDAALAERTRVARELHDTLLQGFTGITLQLQGVLRTIERSPDTAAAERLAQTLSVADATLLDARRMIWDMRAPELEHNDLSAALERAAMQAVADTPITVRFQVKGRTRRLAPLVESTALRVGREATTNAVRHAAASTIDIDLVYADAHLELTVRDDGRGFDGATASAAALPGHWGVSGMRERSAGVGGTLDIRGAPGVGTVVSLRLPTNLEPVTLHQHNNA